MGGFVLPEKYRIFRIVFNITVEKSVQNVGFIPVTFS
jgi:hypothetical protein